MRNYKYLKTDLENLRFLHRLHKIYNSPKKIKASKIYPQSQSENKTLNNSRTIYLQKTTNNTYFPVKVRVLKKTDYSYSPNKSGYYSPSHSGINNSYAFVSYNKDNKNYSKKKNKSNNIDLYNDNLKFNNNLLRINKLKNSLGNPNQARNIMINNIDRNNRFISISPSQDTNKEDTKNKNNDYLRYNDNTIEENNYNYDSSHKMRYLLSKDYAKRFKTINNSNSNKKYHHNLTYNKNYSNNDKYKSYSNKFFSTIQKNNINRFNMDSSPGANSYITDTQIKKGNKYIYNIQSKKITPNATPILNQNPNTSYIIPQNRIIEEEIQFNDTSNNNNIIHLRNNIYSNNKLGNRNAAYNIIEIKLDDLIFIEGRLIDIILALNKDKNIFAINAINESVEFFVFYFHSSLKNKLTLFFMEQNRIVIKSAFNLQLFIIMITYHLSLNPSMLNKVLLLIKQIYNLLKMNLFLFIRKIELYYGDDFCRKNDIYFKGCNYYLNENKLDNLYENEIINIINNNCISMVRDIGNILNYYASINNNYYYDFKNIYLNLSRIDEKDISDYFYKYLFNSTKENIIIQQRINNYSIDNIENSNYVGTNDNIFYNYNNNYRQANQIQNLNQEQEEDEGFLNEIILSYKKNKEMPPFLKYKNPKKYTLVLDLEDTLISVKIINNGKILIRPRPGLISFLTGIKQYYEIISFSKLSQNYSSTIIEQIEENRKLFDYNLYREHCTLVGRKFIKDISNIGRDMKKIIMVDDLPENLNLHIENGILILPYDGDDNKDDRVLYELKKLLILFYNLGYEDLRNAIKSYKDEIYQKITLGLTE